MGSLRSSGSGAAVPVESVDPEAACALLASGQYGYVDVRMWEDFDKGHVAGARNVPYYLSVTPHGKEHNPHFVDQGFTNVKNLEGGYLSLLKSASYPQPAASHH
ncbi:unnamed protein product [Triticum turgidum subsp. durum]|uniref:Rhodanese domain-containing protein n=1 Tax=Triticum turgidum subsp. durum TaxID=4567 RepID=A0A9R0XRA2_TRITD|nr:unnamed protein product [Triticum turgidum subsp. durum]